jgi:glycosyltransferase involved in cell wall biosynthesis
VTQITSSISVIICAFTEERWDATVAAIQSAHQQTLPPVEVILVIDHNPALLARARANISGIVAIENSQPKGLSGARNSGIAIAQGTFIAFLDDDAIAELDWLEKLYDRCRDPQVMGTGGAVDPLWLGPQPRWFPAEFYWVVGCTYRGLPETFTTVRNLYGGCTCIRKEVFDVVGGFRVGIGRVGSIPKGCEETELCIRARQRWPERVFLYEPAGRINHQIPPVRATWRYFRARCYGEGLSKAAIARFVGAKDGLSTERSYTLRTLPLGVWHGLGDGFVRRDPSGFARAAAIVGGLLTTTAGYLVGSIQQQIEAWKNSSVKEQAIATASIKAEP